MSDGAQAVANDEATLPDPYEIVSINSVAAPSGMHEGNWHRYEICQGHNRIVGYRAGDALVVRETVESIVIALNLRRRTRRGRVQVVLQKAGPGLR
jgi:hypothetical protein